MGDATHRIVQYGVRQQRALMARLGGVEGVVQIRVTPKTRNPFTIKALSISGVTWKWHFLNHAKIRDAYRKPF